MAKEMTIGIVGAGQMGGGIAQVASQAGLPVILYDLRPETLRTSQSEMRKSLLRLQRGGKTTEVEAAAVLDRVRLTSDFDHLGAADFVIEAAPENFDIKKSTMQYLDELCAPEVVFASNTSSISLTQLGAATNRPDRVIGMHFMNPPAVLPLVEIVRGLGTPDAPDAAARHLATRMGKRDVRVSD